MLTRTDALLAFAALCAASFVKDFAMGASWATTIDIGLAGYAKFAEAAVEPGIFGVGSIDELLAPCPQPCPAHGQGDRAAVGVEINVPALRAGLEEVEFGRDLQPLRIAERKIGGDRRVAIGGECEVRRRHE